MVGVRKYSGFGKLEEFDNGKEVQDSFPFPFLLRISLFFSISHQMLRPCGRLVKRVMELNVWYRANTGKAIM